MREFSREKERNWKEERERSEAIRRKERIFGSN